MYSTNAFCFSVTIFYVIISMVVNKLGLKCARIYSQFQQPKIPNYLRDQCRDQKALKRKPSKNQ